MLCRRRGCVLRNSKFCKQRCQFNDAKLQQPPREQAKNKRPRTRIQMMVAEVDAIVRAEQKIEAAKGARKR
jgi:hypothetical protein